MTLDLKNPVSNFLFWFCFLLYCSNFCLAIDTIKPGESVRDGGETLISKGETFELGFFSPENSTLRYVGIWYYKTEVKPVVWVANRDSPISGTNGVFRIQSDGNLVVLDGNNSIIWTSNGTVESSNTAAILLDSGNFVLSSNLSIGDTSKAYWQSFDHPTDTYLPGMRVLVSSTKGQNHAFGSWKSATDPSSGNFTMGVDPFGAPQIVIWNGTRRLWRSGQWNGVVFIGVPFMSSLASIFYGFKLSQPASDGSMYFTYVPSNASDLLRFRITWNGSEEQLRWENDKQIWDVVQIEPMNECEFYNSCGNFGVCDISSSPRCSCPQGFRPKFQEQWNRGSFSGGCVRKTELQCQRNDSNVKQDGFKGLKGIKLPDFAHVVSLGDSETCSEHCLGNCSCNAYADVTGIGCMIWTGDLLDLQQFNNGGSVMFLRLPHSELGSGIKTYIIVIIAVCAVVGVCLLCISIWLFLRFKRKHHKGKQGKNPKMVNSIPVYHDSNVTEFSKDISGSVDLVIDGSEEYGPDLPLFNAKFVAAATNNFSEENKLGQGGFGPVYKGELPGGQEIAVKRLAGKSFQGLEEFKNEIIMIAKLQHRNLVRLLGCCIQGEEKMLLYEYMPNKSLDYFIFDEAKQALLDWRTRFTIIEGIARGLLYLHRDSRLRIIHRDLKASNILLDAEMIPKISDFGMARIFGTNQIEANTIRVVGTYGYMSPEYAMEGLFSIKSDVYSFGVLLLEIVSGRRNTSFRASDHTSLIGYAWDLWNENKPMELIDPATKETCDAAEVLKCIHVGMLCVQDSAADRPRMDEVVRMLESAGPTLPAPRQPTYTSMRSTLDAESLLDVTVSSSDATVSMVAGR